MGYRSQNYYNYYYFPEEIIREILKRVPAKSLIKCSLVCKSWYTLIRSPKFIDAHLSGTIFIQSNRQNQSKGQQIFLLRSLEPVPKFFYSTSVGGDYTKFMQPPIFYEGSLARFSLRMVGTCNGLICLASWWNIKAPQIIWNPSVRKYMILPTPSSTFSKNRFLEAHHYIGYDSRTGDYKVLRIETDFSTYIQSVYSLARGSWKSIGVPAVLRFGMLRWWPVSHNGSLHWVQHRNIAGIERIFILTFDIGSDVLMVPETLGEKGLSIDYFISRYEECLALIEVEKNHEDKTSELHLWVMKEYGVVESWTKLDNSVTLQGFDLKPFGFTSHDERVIKICVGHKLKPTVTVDFKNKKAKEWGIDGNFFKSLDPFVESLVLFDQPNAVSY